MSGHVTLEELEEIEEYFRTIYNNMCPECLENIHIEAARQQSVQLMDELIEKCDYESPRKQSFDSWMQ